MDRNGRVLVVGATGRLGREIVGLLREAQRNVRAVVRPRGATGRDTTFGDEAVDAAAADLKDPTSLGVACEDVETVVSTATAIVSRRDGDSIESVDERGQLALIDAAETRGVRHFVFISFPPNGLDYAFQRAKRRVEARLRESAMSFTILQALPFCEIWLGAPIGFTPWLGKARVLGSGEQPVSWISLQDVARFAVAACESDRFDRATIPLGGPDPLSPLRVVEIFEELGGKKVTVERVPEVALEARLGAARDAIEEGFAASALVTSRGKVLDPAHALALLPGRLISVRDYAKRMLAVQSEQGS